MNNPLTIAIDFDGTIVEHKYPEIGKELPLATHTLKTLAQKGHRLILWTYRSGRELDEAVEFCRSRGVEFYAINKNFPEEEFTPDVSRKILADLYIDDRNLRGIPSWPEIYHIIHPEEAPSAPPQKKTPRWKFW
jgi:hydroxymethylpyrimidine pyrophosphatase-like HAD family hydrolase